MRKLYLLAITLFLGMPVNAFGSVIISEIAWMGTENSGTDEWIELYNNGGEAVDLSGWKIEALDGSPVIALSGTVTAGSYFLIERTDDSTLLDVAADLIAPFGSGLSNAGETLWLKNASDALIDTASGGADWENIGGDNATKQTAQRTNSGWITGVGTPRAANVSPPAQEAVLGASTQGAAETANGPTSESVAKPSPYPRKEITVRAESVERAFVNFPVAFAGNALGLYDEDLAYATYRWNFGDGSIALGKTAEHAFLFPGEYTVTLHASWANHSKTDRVLVVVSDPEVLIAKVIPGEKGLVELRNKHAREIDLSNWRLEQSSAKSFYIPQETVIAPGKSLLLPNTHTGFFAESERLALLYPNGKEAHVYFAPTALSPQKTAVVHQAKEVKGVASEGESSPKILAAAPAKEAAAVVLWEQPHVEEGSTWPIVVLVTLLMAVTAYVLFRRKNEVPTSEEYLVVEELIESENKR